MMTLIPLHPSRRGGRNGKGERLQDHRRPVGAMIRRFLNSPVGILAALLFLPALLPTPLLAREDSAQLVFQKVASYSKNRTHVVKKGEWIAAIFRNQFGDEPVPYTLIRRLNPGIRNLNLVRPGQRIVLPIPGDSGSPGSITNLREESRPPILYRIREDDSISRIILSELKLNPSEILPAYRLIRKLNPEIENMARLPAGHSLRLPPLPAAQPLTYASSPKDVSVPTEPAGTETAVGTSTTVDALQGIIRPVIHRMRGTVATSGNHFIPLQETNQLIIDCSRIPVVELDDGTTVLLDYGNLLPDNLRELIRQSWKNYAFLASEELGDDIQSLQGIIRRSSNYRMVRSDQPLALTAKPELLTFPDWVIAGQETGRGAHYRQGLFLLDRDEPPLPADARAFLEESGLVVTEIAGNRTVSSGEMPPTVQPVKARLQDLKGIALVEQLLALLGETTVRNAEVVVFDQARNGFNLYITADLLLRKGERRFMLHTKKLPESFVRILREAGTETLLIGENDQGRTFVESVLRGLSIPVSYGHFMFRIPDDGPRPRLSVSFSALRVTTEAESLYLIDFDASPEGLSFLDGRQRGRVVRY